MTRCCSSVSTACCFEKTALLDATWHHKLQLTVCSAYNKASCTQLVYVIGAHNLRLVLRYFPSILEVFLDIRIIYLALPKNELKITAEHVAWDLIHRSTSSYNLLQLGVLTHSPRQIHDAKYLADSIWSLLLDNSVNKTKIVILAFDSNLLQYQDIDLLLEWDTLISMYIYSCGYTLGRQCQD